MFREQLFEPCGVDVFVVLKDQAEDVRVGPVAADAGRIAKGLDSAQIELSFLALESAIEAVTVFGSPLGPGAADAGHSPSDGGARIPLNFKSRVDLFD